MNRIIKFRAWDNNKKVIRYLWDMYCGTYWSMFDNFEDEDIMQFTWLLDKNGKEIYEGDILKITSKTWYSDHWSEWWVQIDGVEPEVDVSYVSVKQKWNAWTIPLSHEYTHEDWTRARIVDREIEVIWNIYQNPELLK